MHKLIIKPEDLHATLLLGGPVLGLYISKDIFLHCQKQLDDTLWKEYNNENLKFCIVKQTSETTAYEEWLFGENN